MNWLRQLCARCCHHVHDLSMFSCLAYFEGHWLVLTFAGLTVTIAVVALSLLWEEVK
jgi:hypothetical protein